MSGRHYLRNWHTVRKNSNQKASFFFDEIYQLLKTDVRWVRDAAAEYYRCFSAWKRLSSYRSASPKTDGITKTLDVAEGFALWAVVKRLRPAVVVELGTQFGISARLWKEALKAYVPQHELILCDIADGRRFIGDDESTFIKGDARDTLPNIFNSVKVDLLFNDVHPYDLIYWSTQEGLKHDVTTFAFHDVGGKHPRGPFNAGHATLPIDVKIAGNEDYARYGHWERHIMAEIFDERILHHDAVQNESNRLQIFDSLFGVGVVIQQSKLLANAQ